jgi:dihydropteroate synthase
MRIRILKLRNEQEALESIKQIGVYPESFRFLKPKSFYLTIKLGKLSSAACNIIKQEMLSLGADAAVAKDVISGKVKFSDCLLFGNISQYDKLCLKLARQPLGLKEIARQIKISIACYQKSDYIFRCGSRKLYPGKKIYLMGILNVTPDSFSDGNLFYDEETAIKHGISLVKNGADIIDVGGESTRPGAKTVSAKEQIKRVIPVIKGLKKKIKEPISIDTRNSKVAEAAVKAGASIINDVSGLRYDEKIARVAAKYKAGLILMHSKQNPKTMQKNPRYNSLMSEIIESLELSVNKALSNNVKPEQIVIDPGIGFSKTTEHNLEALNKLAELRVLGYPILVGTSRKSVIGNVLDLPIEKRLAGTIATVVYSIMEGAALIRAHDVNEVARAIKMTQAISKAG